MVDWRCGSGTWGCWWERYVVGRLAIGGHLVGDVGKFVSTEHREHRCFFGFDFCTTNSKKRVAIYKAFNFFWNFV